MTAIVGAIDGNDVVIGADSALTDGWARTALIHTRDCKAFLLRHGTVAVGLCGAVRPVQLIRSFDPPPRHADDEDTTAYLTGTFVDHLRSHLRRAGALKTENGLESAPETGGLIGCAGRLFHLETDLSCWEHAEPYAAHGHGYLFALGALRALSVRGVAGEDLVRAALDATAHHDATVRPPFVIVRLKGSPQPATTAASVSSGTEPDTGPKGTG